MPRNTLNLEWLNHNASRAYPLAEDATATSIDEGFVLPKSFIVGLRLNVPALQNVGPAGFFIRYIGSYATGFSVTIAYQPDDDSDPINVASAQISRAAHVRNQTYSLTGIGDFENSRGRIVIGALDDIDDQPAGQFEFDLEGGRLETEAVLPQIRGVDSVVFVNGTDESDPIYSRLRLRAGPNIQFRLVEQDDEQTVVEVSAISGINLNEDCVCTDDNATPVKSINGVFADSSGNINLLGSQCLTVSSITNGLRLTDTCSNPCCDCTDLAKLTSSLEIFGQKAATIDNFVTGLEAAVRQMDAVVLGSRLNDRGCG